MLAGVVTGGCIDLCLVSDPRYIRNNNYIKLELVTKVQFIFHKYMNIYIMKLYLCIRIYKVMFSVIYRINNVAVIIIFIVVL